MPNAGCPALTLDIYFLLLKRLFVLFFLGRKKNDIDPLALWRPPFLQVVALLSQNDDAAEYFNNAEL